MRLTIFTIILVLFSCSILPAQQPKNYNNVIVLLDLSNRIKPNRNPQQALKDQKIIHGLLQAFQERQKRYLFQISKDKIRVEVAYQKDSEYNTFQFGEDLFIDMGTPGMNKPIFDDKKEVFTKAVTKLYSEAVKSKTTGADIWSYFRDNLPSVLEVENDRVSYRNKLIILTDGYMDLDKELAGHRPVGTYMNYNHIGSLRNKSNWEEVYENSNISLMPHDIDYPNLEVLVIEVVPKDPSVNVNEFPIIKKYWFDWLDNMGIENLIYATNDNVNNTLGIINRFLDN